jgi:putative intracellular protease/amidase
VENKPQVLLLLREGSHDVEFMLTWEVGVMVKMLKAAGLAVVVASASGRTVGRHAMKLKPDLKLAEVRVADYAGIILPSMAVGLTIPVNPKAIGIVRKAVAGNRVVAAQHGSVVVLQRAGVLKKKKYAFERRVFSEGVYAGTGVIQDGNLITSGTCPYLARETGRPDGTLELTRLLIDSIVHDGGSSTN